MKKGFQASRQGTSLQSYALPFFLSSVKTLLGFLLLGFALPAFSQQTAKSIYSSQAPGHIIRFLEFKPTDYGTQYHPVIIFLHGAGEKGNGSKPIDTIANVPGTTPYYCARGASMRFTVGGQTSSFVVLSPQLSDSLDSWRSYYVAQMIAYAKDSLHIDPNRIYLTGLSLGGGGVWGAVTDIYLGSTFDAGIAAVAPVCGTQTYSDANFCTTIGNNHLPVWALHSIDDVTVGVAATKRADSISLTCPVSPASKFTYFQSGGHSGAWNKAYDTTHPVWTVEGGGSFTANPNLYEWFLSNTRGTTNIPPTANAGSNQTIILPASTTTLTGSGTGNGGATITGYAWSKFSGPTAGTITSVNSATTGVTGLVQGVYVFRLTVTDNHSLTGTADVTVTVSNNQPPIANAGYDKYIVLPTNSISLDGSGSYDPDGSIVSYLWTKVSGGAATITSPGSATTTVTGLTNGHYYFRLKVTDNDSAVSYDTMHLLVNQRPVANIAGNPISITLPVDSVLLNGTGSTDDDGIQYYAWSQVSGPGTATIVSATSSSTQVKSLVGGTYVFRLIITDYPGAKDTAQITVNVLGNQSPIANAGYDKYIVLPTNSISLDGSGSYDPDGSIVSYLWTKVSGGAATITSPGSATTTVTGLTNGTYYFRLQVTDNGGKISYDTMVLLVNQRPVANIAGNPISITLPVDSVLLNGTGSTDDDGIQYYAWSQVSGPGTATIVSATSSSTEVKSLVGGTYVFRLIITDYPGAKDTAQITVNVSGNQPPVANAGPDKYIVLPANSITLDGSGSSDPDGSIASYLWTKLTGGAATITSSTSVTTTVTGLVNGHYTFQLKVTDNGGAFTYDTMALYVNQKPTANIAGNPITITLPVDSVLLNGSGSTDDDGIQSYAWSKVSGPGSPNIFTPAVSSTKVTGLSTAGVYVFQLIVTDWGGAKDTAQVTVNVSGSGGRVAAISPGNTAAITDSSSTAAMGLYPNPVHSQATITFFSNDNSVKTIYLYSAGGVLQAKYTWTVKKGNNIYYLNKSAGLTQGMYIVDIRDSNGKQAGKTRFIKL